MPNKLANENSPYLLQHAENPVDWYPWSAEALEKARREDKPIFLSIGYAACHWCHVMAHESFENPQIAALMNENFVNIKVDREERPDLDSIYMNAVVAMTGSGGWPMSLFLTPDGLPFFGGTYFPPVRRYNMPSFSELLLTLARLWKEDRQRLLQTGKEILRHLQSSQSLPAPEGPYREKILEEAALHLAQTYDWNDGGWGHAPKFPQPMAIEFLLRRAAQGDKLALDVAIHALKAMAKGGMYDVVGGGFARYSTDDDWLVPHFEKMLYDNAQLAQVYLHAYLLTGDSGFQQVCTETLDFIIREMMQSDTMQSDTMQSDTMQSDTMQSDSDAVAPQGGMFSSLDADSQGKEGKYYLWTLSEIRTVLSKAQAIEAQNIVPDWASFFINAYNITEEGNFEGHTILQRSLEDQALANQYAIPIDQVRELLKKIHSALLQEREKRVHPGVDDKVLVSWNSLALIAFSEAARYLKRPDYLDIARKNADFLLAELHPKDRLLRSWRKGQARHNAYLEDYSSLILGLLSLYQSDPDPYWYNSSVQLTNSMLEHFRDPRGGFFDTRDDHDPLLMRPKDLQDNATPSGNALAVQALLQLSTYTGNGEWRDIAETTFGLVQALVAQYPTAFSKWLCAIEFASAPIQEVAILGNPDLSQTQALITALWNNFRPHALAAISNFPPPPNSPPLLLERILLQDQPTAYVCQHFVCYQPVNSPEKLAAQLLDIRS